MKLKNPKRDNYLVLSFSILFLLICLTLPNLIQDTILLNNRLNNLSEDLDHYYYNGWPVDNLREEFQDDYPKTSILSTCMISLPARSVKSYRTDLENIIDNRIENDIQQLSEQKSISSRFYIEKIQQPTKNLERYEEEFYSGLESENYLMASESLDKYSTETTILREKQNRVIEDEIESTIAAIEDTAFIGKYYGIQFDEKVKDIETIRENNQSNFDKYQDLNTIKNEETDRLDEKIIERGGRSTHGKRILVTISSQKLYMIEDYEIVHEMPISSGKHGHRTALGEFQVYEKVPNAWGYYEIWMPYWLTIYYSSGLENGIHGIPVSPTSGRWTHWENVVGVYPITYGCIMPLDHDAKKLYNWAEVGTPVSVVY